MEEGKEEALPTAEIEDVPLQPLRDLRLCWNIRDPAGTPPGLDPDTLRSISYGDAHVWAGVEAWGTERAVHLCASAGNIDATCVIGPHQ